jgi:hypothetical protein
MHAHVPGEAFIPVVGRAGSRRNLDSTGMNVASGGQNHSGDVIDVLSRLRPISGAEEELETEVPRDSMSRRASRPRRGLRVV